MSSEEEQWLLVSLTLPQIDSDSSPDWRGSQSSLQHFYPSKCFSSKWDVSKWSSPDFMPPNGPDTSSLYKCFTSKCYTWDKWDTSKWLPPIFRPPNCPAGQLRRLQLVSSTTDIWQWFDCLWSLASLLWMSSSKVTWCHQQERGVFAFLPRAMRGKPLPINDDQLNLICPRLPLSFADWRLESKNWVRFLQTVCNDIFLLR